ncbi:hypothetical protein GRJ22_16670 [Photobacterium carnosum]|uniref:hypothetical protein n=1 Tax=Photobacterium carnosum TaxID=2023717 RepID=UPI001E45CA4D|nr:hypothetical protein [Photobacterium carnosum]MCD9525863.1 hypothetical protein [Photobacterium carnosum]MCD9558030.1 hypothetical protein [Photobacterium carnosum]
MDINQLIAFSWSAVAGGIYYDALKVTLGKAFSRLEVFKQENKKELFEATLHGILETNQQISDEISSMARGDYNTEVTNITTGNIHAGGAVVVGNHNTIGGSK